MPKQNDRDDYELRDEYDFSQMIIVAKGRYAPERRRARTWCCWPRMWLRRFRPMMPSTRCCASSCGSPRFR